MFILFFVFINQRVNTLLVNITNITRHVIKYELKLDIIYGISKQELSQEKYRYYNYDNNNVMTL